MLVLDNITIKTDSEGRFCLNDLHKAAGGNPKDRPEQWFRNQAYKDLANQLFIEANCADLRIKPMECHRGRNGGTYVVKELVYAYAMWISPTFHLKVIRAYDRLATQGVAVHENAAVRMVAFTPEAILCLCRRSLNSSPTTWKRSSQLVPSC